MISVQFAGTQLNVNDQYIINAEWKLPGWPKPQSFQGKADLFIKSDFVRLRDSKTSKEFFCIRCADILKSRRNSKPNRFTLNLVSKGYITLVSNTSLVEIADSFNIHRG